MDSEAVGDYLAGPNHTLPTSGNSRFSGSLGVETFMKNTSIIEFNEKSLKENSNDIINLAKVKVYIVTLNQYK